MNVEQIRQVRSFNRLVTQRVGTLEDSYLSRGRPFGEARLIFEIGSMIGPTCALRSRLGLDSGYLSRLLRSLEGQGLVEVSQNADDGRVRQVNLTASGLHEFRSYDTLSDDLAHSILFNARCRTARKTGCGDGRGERLIRHLIDHDCRYLHSGDAQFCLGCYRAELDSRFDRGFDPSKGNNLTVRDDAAGGYLLLARLEGEPVGCGAPADQHG